MAEGNTQVIGAPVKHLRASATRIQLGDKQLAKKQAGKRQEWQDEAFEYFDDVGMVKYVVWFLGNQLAKLRLFAAVRPLDDPEGQPIPCNDPQSGIPTELAQQAQAEIERIKGRSGGTGEILRMINMNIEVAGECYVVGIGPRIKNGVDELTGEPLEVLHLEQWDVKSILEVIVGSDGKYQVKDEQTDEPITLEAGLDQCVRIWQRHPGWSKRADCHMRGVLTDCESLVLLTNEVKAESKSRQSNGILLIPNTLSVTTPGRTTPADQDPDPDAIDEVPDDAGEPAAATVAEVLEEAIMEPISDPGSAWSVWPVIMIGPAEDLKEVRHVQLHRETSAVLEARITARKESIAQGMNAPVEVAQGHMNTTFANAVQVDADIFEKHLEPRCVLICDMWTVGLLQPALIDSGVLPELAERVIVWYEASRLIKRVDPAEAASEGITLDTISDEAWRRYRGFTEDDAPPPIDRLIRAILHQRSWDPGLVDAVVKALDPGLKIPPPQAKGGAPGAPPEAPTQPEKASIVRDLLALQLEGPESTSRAAVLAMLYELRDATRTLRASATVDTTEAGSGARLAAGDRDLMTKLLPTLNSAMARCLERAGSRLKARQGPTHATLRTVNPIYAGRLLGPELVASLGIDDTDLIDADAFEGALAQYSTWAKHWQNRALKIAAGLAGLTAGARAHLDTLQAQHLSESVDWLRTNLHELASARLYEPDAREPARGEFDPSSRVPPGLARMGIAIAGGALALDLVGNPSSYIATTADGKAPGGIGTGALLTTAILEPGTIVVEGYQWDYGDAFRKSPYEPHESLDGLVMESPIDFVADPEDSEVGDYYFPGDHDGCLCGELIPVYAQAPDEVHGSDAGTGMDAPDRGDGSVLFSDDAAAATAARNEAP